MYFSTDLSVPDPTSVIVTADPPTPIRAGTELTLTCTVELSPTLAGLSSLAVIVVWTEPFKSLTSSYPIDVTPESPPTSTSILQLQASVPFNGNYTCQAQVVSSSSSLTNSGRETNMIAVIICKQPSVVVLIYICYVVLFPLQWILLICLLIFCLVLTLLERTTVWSVLP